MKGGRPQEANSIRDIAKALGLSRAAVFQYERSGIRKLWRGRHKLMEKLKCQTSTAN